VTDAQADELLELQRAMLARLDQLARYSARAAIGEAKALTKRQVEKALAIHRSRLAEHVRAGTIKTVPWGKGERIPKEEVDRIVRDGLPELPGQPEPSTPRAPRRRAAARPRAPAAKEGSPGDRIRELEVV